MDQMLQVQTLPCYAHAETKLFPRMRTAGKAVVGNSFYTRIFYGRKNLIQKLLNGEVMSTNWNTEAYGSM